MSVELMVVVLALRSVGLMVVVLAGLLALKSVGLMVVVLAGLLDLLLIQVCHGIAIGAAR